MLRILSKTGSNLLFISPPAVVKKDKLFLKGFANLISFQSNGGNYLAGNTSLKEIMTHTAMSVEDRPP